MTQQAIGTVPEGYPLSPIQKWLWQIAHKTDACAQFGILLTGKPDMERLTAAVARLVARHEILRTRYPTSPLLDRPLQAIGEDATCWEDVADFRDRDETDAFAYLADRARIQPERGPCLHLQPLLLDDERLLLRFAMPLLSADASTPALFTAELARAYGEGEPDCPAEPSLQYADYSQWRIETLEREKRNEHRFWDGREGDPDRHGTLPFQKRSETEPGQAFVDVCLDGNPAEPGERSFHLMLACWYWFLARLTNGPVTSGVYFDGRDYPELASLLGPAGQYLPVSVSPRPDRRLAGLVKQVARQVREAAEFQGEYFHELAERREPLPFAFEYHRQAPKVVAHGLGFQLWDRRIHAAQRQFRLECRHGSGVLTLRLHYDRARLARHHVGKLGQWLEVLLRHFLAEPDLLLRDLAWLEDAERQWQMHELNGVRAPIQEGCIHTLFEAAAARCPDRVALVFQSRSLTFETLNRRADRLALGLRARGVFAETPVAVSMPRGPDMMIAVLGVLKAGGYYVPMDPEDPPHRQRAVLADAAIRLVLTAPDGNHPLRDPRWQDGSFTILTPSDIQRESRSHSGKNPPCQADNLAYAIFTSGSTGKPKGVTVSHRAPINLLSGLRALVYRHLPDRCLRVSMNAPLMFDASVQQWIALLDGHCLCLVPEAVRMDGQGMVAYLDRFAVEVLDCTPAHLAVLMEAGLPDRSSSRLKGVLVAGGAVHADMWNRLADCEAPLFFDIYGPTECTVDASGCRISVSGSTPSIGRPLANYRIFLTGPGPGIVPAGLPGELAIGGPGLARGYLARPGMTASRFVPDPFCDLPGERLYRTGDAARFLDDGSLAFVGRTDRQVKLRGYRIELGEIEQVLRQHESVSQAVAVVHGEGTDGGERRLVVYFTESKAGERGSPDASGSAKLAAELRGFLRNRLPHYMVPWRIQRLDTVPLTASGKVDTAALPEPSREEGAADVRDGHPLEEMLAGIWCDLLNLRKVGPRDDFFELGGHSLLTTQLASRVRDLFEVEIDLLRFFSATQLGKQAALIEEYQRRGEGLDVPALVKMPRNGPVPASYSQQRLWFMYHAESGSSAYHIPFAFRLSGNLNVPALGSTLAEIVRRHETLRTTFAVAGDQVVQVVHPNSGWRLSLIDLSSLSAADQDVRLDRSARSESLRSFDLERGPLLRIRAFRLSSGEHAVLCQMHHLVSDGWSVGVLVREIVALYSAFSRGEPARLAELPIQYADFAIWQRGWLRGEVFDREIDFWRGRLKGAPAVSKLPYEGRYPERVSDAAGLKTVSLGEELSARIKRLGQSEGATLFMVLLAGFNTLLHHSTGEMDLVVGTDVANRNRSETEKLIGFFINQLAIRADLRGNPTLREALARIRKTTLDAFLHQDMPFDRLVEALNPKRHPQRHPYFQVKFVLQNAPVHQLEISGLTLSAIPGDTETTKLDLQLNMWEENGSLEGLLLYKRELFDAGTMAGFLRQFRHTLELFTEDPGLTLDRIDGLLREHERKYREERASVLRESRIEKFKSLLGTAT